MRFRYLPQRVTSTPAAPHLDVLYRPVIPVRFHGPNGSVRVRALLDTGADESYVTETVADRIGLVPVHSEESTILSASGPMSVWYAATTIEVSNLDLRYAFSAVVGVVSQDWDELILGHIGFLQFFDASFSHVDKHVTLSNRVSDFTLNR